jgi:hypothetical protein
MKMSNRKYTCPHCGRLVVSGQDCICKKKRTEAWKKKYNERKRLWYKNNKDTQKILNSTKWRKLRSRIMDLDGHKCIRCYKKFGVVNQEDLQVHHIKPRAIYPELVFEEDNLVTTCKKCNLELGLSGIDFEWSPEERNQEYFL